LFYYKEWDWLKQEFILAQPIDRQKQIQYAVNELTHDITKVVSMKNRDKFTLNLSIFRRNIHSHTLFPPAVPPVDPFEMCLP
jgi:hypothetical protein